MSSRAPGRRRGGGAVPQEYTLRVGLRLDDALIRVQAGDALVVDVLDMDRSTARRILASGAASVLNVATSYSGRFPVSGPQLLVESGVVLIDALGSSAAVLRDGERVELRGDDVVQHGEVVLTGRRRFLSDLAHDAGVAASSGGVRVRSEALVADVVALLRAPDGVRRDVPAGLEDLVRGRAVVLVCADIDARQVATLSAMRDRVIVAVGDDGLIACRDRGLKPDGVLGATPDAMAERVDEIDDERTPGRGRRRQRPVQEVVVAGLSANRPAVDAASALLFAAGAAAVVIAGADDADDPLMGLLDRPRADAASTGLLRLDNGGRLVSMATLEVILGRTTAPRKAPRAGMLATPRGRRIAVTSGVVGALIVGVLLGVGPLARFGPTGSDRDATSQSLSDATSANADLNQQVSSADTFLAAQQPSIVAGELKGHRAVIVASAGIDSTVIQGVTEVLTQAGASFAGTVQLVPGFNAPSRQATLDDLATRLQPAGTQPAVGPPGSRVGAALGASIATTSVAGVGTAAAQGQGLLDALGQVGVVQVSGQPWLRSDLVVYLVPDSGTDVQVAAQSRLAGALGQAATATVVTTPAIPRPGSTASVVAASLGAGQRVAVSDLSERAVGRIAVVTALKSGLQGRFGVYGALAASTPLPAPSPSVSPTATP